MRSSRVGTARRPPGAEAASAVGGSPRSSRGTHGSGAHRVTGGSPGAGACPSPASWDVRDGSSFDAWGRPAGHRAGRQGWPAVGWLTGIEPATTGTTIRGSTTELQPPSTPSSLPVHWSSRFRPSGEGSVGAGLSGRWAAGSHLTRCRDSRGRTDRRWEGNQSVRSREGGDISGSGLRSQSEVLRAVSSRSVEALRPLLRPSDAPQRGTVGNDLQNILPDRQHAPLAPRNLTGAIGDLVIMVISTPT